MFQITRGKRACAGNARRHIGEYLPEMLSPLSFGTAFQTGFHPVGQVRPHRRIGWLIIIHGATGIGSTIVGLLEKLFYSPKGCFQSVYNARGRRHASMPASSR